MTTDERNFRSSYYEKVGCYSVEEKKSLKKLLQDDIRNHAKLKQFCLSYTVPQFERTMLWSIILGVLPLHKKSETFFHEQRKAIYEDILRAVTVMQYIDANTSKHRMLLTIWQCENNRLLHPQAGQQEHDTNFIEIVKVLLEIFKDEVDIYIIYWIAVEFYALTKDIQKDRIKLKESTLSLIKQDAILCSHLDKLNILIIGRNDDFISKWYASSFAGIISELTLVKIWDKIVGGSPNIIIFLFIELIMTFREQILNCNTLNDFKVIIENIKDQDAAIVNKAIKSWQTNKNHNEIAVH